MTALSSVSFGKSPVNVHVEPSVDFQLAPLKSCRTQPTATRPAGPAATPVVSVSTAGWHGAHPRLYGFPDASVWTVMNPLGCSTSGARSQAAGVAIAPALGVALGAGAAHPATPTTRPTATRT